MLTTELFRDMHKLPRNVVHSWTLSCALRWIASRRSLKTSILVCSTCHLRQVAWSRILETQSCRISPHHRRVRRCRRAWHLLAADRCRHCVCLPWHSSICQTHSERGFMTRSYKSMRCCSQQYLRRRLLPPRSIWLNVESWSFFVFRVCSSFQMFENPKPPSSQTPTLLSKSCKCV